MQVRQVLTIGENPLKRKPKVKTTKKSPNLATFLSVKTQSMIRLYAEQFVVQTR